MMEAPVEELDTSLAGADLRNKDLRGYDFRDKVLFQTDLRGSKLYGASFSAHCANWEGVMLDDKQVAWLLLLLSKVDCPWTNQLRALARDVVGVKEFRDIEKLGTLI
jgi:hypothetical protein